MKGTNQKGITLIALIVTIIVLVIIAGISIATLTADNGVLRQTNLAKVENIEGTAREQVRLACSAMRLAIAEAQALDNSYKASDNRDKIRDVLLNTIKADTTALEKDGWSAANDTTANIFKIIYAGNDYKQACNDDNAEIVYIITLGQKSIEITNETNDTLKDQNGNDANLDIGGSTGSGTGSGSESGGGGENVTLVAGLYQTGTTTLIKDWNTLISEGILSSTGSIVYGQEANLAGDLVISDSLTSLANYSFKGCTSLTGVKIPENVKIISDYAFQNCTNLISVDFDENNLLTTIGNYAFNGCTSLTGVEIPESVTTIGGGAFQGCASINHVEIPTNVKTINSNTFNNCINLTGIEISDNVTSIGNSAFKNCTSLTSITIPSNVTNIDDFIIRDCTNLTSIIVLATEPPTLSQHAFYGSSITTITVPSDCYDTYIAASVWSNYADKIVK